jgi:hypothetical protein
MVSVLVPDVRLLGLTHPSQILADGGRPEVVVVDAWIASTLRCRHRVAFEWLFELPLSPADRRTGATWARATTVRGRFVRCHAALY